MGSPSNQFGNDPDAHLVADRRHVTAADVPELLGQHQRRRHREAARRRVRGQLVRHGGALVTDGCSGIGDGNNVNYTPNGYYYAVDFTAAGTADLQAFDPAFVHVGQLCTDGSANLAGAAALANIPSYPEGATNTADIQKRFQPVTDTSNPADPGFQYCTGDNSFPNSAGNNVAAPNTTYTVWKATVPGHPESATQVCGPITYPGFNGNVRDARCSTPTLRAVLPAVGDAVHGERRQGRRVLHPGADRQRRREQPLRAARRDRRQQPGAGHDRGQHLHGHVRERRKQSAHEVLPGARSDGGEGPHLLLNFYDIGDANSTGQLAGRAADRQQRRRTFGNTFSAVAMDRQLGQRGERLLRSVSLNVAVGDRCRRSPTARSPASTTTPTSGTRSGARSPVPIPADYSCTDADPQGCWLTINYKFNGKVHDVTSWTAALLGDPVRLVK